MICVYVICSLPVALHASLRCNAMMGPRAQLKLEAEKKERFEREQAAMARAARQGQRKGKAAKGRGKGRGKSRGKGGGGRARREDAKAPAVVGARDLDLTGSIHRALDPMVPIGELSHPPSPPPLQDVGHARGRRHGRRTTSMPNRGEDDFGNGDNRNRSAAMSAIVDWAAAANRAAGLPVPAGRAGTSDGAGDGGDAMLHQFDESGRLPPARR